MAPSFSCFAGWETLTVAVVAHMPFMWLVAQQPNRVTTPTDPEELPSVAYVVERVLLLVGGNPIPMPLSLINLTRYSYLLT